MIYIKRYLSSLLIISLLINIFTINLCYAEDDGIKVLLIGSYSIDNYWENSVIDGFKETIDNEVSLKIEFMDSKMKRFEDYYQSFVDFLNSKYKEMNLDYIITLDDEAFNMVRNNLFVEDSFAYKKTIMFTGVNSITKLTNEEKDYITGMLEYQNNLYNLNTILKTKKNVNKVYLILDESIYSNEIKESFFKASESAVKYVDISVIRNPHLHNIDKEIELIDSSDSAIVVCGEFYDGVNRKILSPAAVINHIKSLTNAPIYTNLKEYVEGGAIGGYINDGNIVGQFAAQFLTRIIYGEEKVLLAPTYNMLNIPLFNFKAIREYDINPQLLPEDSRLINKSRFNLLVPKKVEVLIWILFIISSFTIVILAVVSYRNNKQAYKNKNLLEESIKRDELKTDLFLTMSHELRTPINIILNSANLLKNIMEQEIMDRKVVFRQIKYIKKNSNRLLKLVNNLIDVNKLDSNHMSFVFVNCNVVEVIEDAVQAVADLAASYNISVTFDTEEEEIIMAVDKSKIERIILNLLSNSIKFIGNGTYILVKVYRNESTLFIEVEDNGKGMSEEMQKNIFDKFRRCDNENVLKREQEGSGLGLYIVKRLVMIHSGNIEIQSTRGIGTKFIISIPIVSVDQDSSYMSNQNRNLEYMVQVELSDINCDEK